MRADDAFYLSAYLAPPGTTSILHSQRHDHAVALWRKRGRRVDLISYWELERLSGLKHHDLGLGTMEATTGLISSLLEEEGLTTADLVEIWGTPGISTNRHIEACFGSETFPVHSLAHLYSALLVDTEVFQAGNIIGMAVDGGPDIALDQTNKRHFYVGAFSRCGTVEHRPIESPGPLFIAAEERFGLAPGSLMALAESSPVDAGLDPSAVVGDLTFYGGYGVYDVARDLIARVIPAAEVAASRVPDHGSHELGREELVASAAMKVVQQVAEIILRRNLELLLAEAEMDPATTHLAIAGGVALNCPANARMMREFGFAGLLAPPCVDDSGQALGLGLLGFASEAPATSFDFQLRHAFHGSHRVDLDEALEEFADRVVSTGPLHLDQFVEDLERSPLGWVDGRAEIGPRALGHRSILADPRSLESKPRINALKGRQWWRPVAPIVLADQMEAWFEDPMPSPFMLLTLQVIEELRATVPAITHLDGSARVQTLSIEDDARLHSVLQHFHLRTGIPMFCNTSLNDRSEPIASTAADAVTFCLRKGVSVLYVEGVRVELDVTAADLPPGPRVRNQALLAAGSEHRRTAWDAWLANGATEEVVYLLNRFPELQHLAETAEGRTQLEQTSESIVRQHALDANFADFVTEFGPDAPGSNRHLS